MKNRKTLVYLIAFTTPLVLTLLVATNVDGTSAKQKVQKMPLEKINDHVTYETLKAAPEGAQPAQQGKIAVVHYTGWLNKGDDTPAATPFDSSVTRGTPFEFPLGAGYVIQGWDLGVSKMKVGQKIRLYIDPEYGYGSRGAGRVIPPNAKLIFDVELIAVR